MFSANLNLERKEQHEILASSLDQAPQRWWGADFGEASHLLLAFCSFLRMPSAGSGASGGVPAGLILVTRNHRGRKIISPLPFAVSAWLSPFYSRASPKWISLSKMVGSSPPWLL